MSLEKIKEEIYKAELLHDRPLNSTNLIAVSKVQPEDRVKKVLENGHRVFGENRVQEARQRWSMLKENFPDVDLHLLGPLQTNKVAEALDLFKAIHSVDREKLARVLSESIQKRGASPEIFIQLNTGEEAQKSGVSPAFADKFIETCRSTYDLPIVGLMCIPPIDEEPSLHFSLLRKVADRNGLVRLSMGMSSDFKTAIAFGATDVRVGSAIFGEREKSVQSK